MAIQVSGGTYVNTTFTATLRSDIQFNIAAKLITAGWTSVAVGVGLGVGNTGTVTISNANPAIVTWSGAHGFLGGEHIILQTTGTLPSGLSVNTVYFVRYINSTTFNLSTTLTGALIATTTTGSGSHTLNTESYVMQSATQPNVQNPIVVHIDDNRGTCTTLSIQSSDGTVVSSNNTSAGESLLPGVGRSYRIIATRYHFICYLSSGAVSGRDFVMAGMLWVPASLNAINVGYLFGNTRTDTVSSTVNAVLRYGMSIYSSNTQGTNYAIIWNSNINQVNNSVNLTGDGTPVLTYWGARRWADDTLNTSDVGLTGGLTSYADEGKLKGQFFDLLYVATGFAGDSLDTFYGYNWLNLAENVSTGGCWVIVP